MNDTELLLSRALWILELELGAGLLSENQDTSLCAVHDHIQRVQQLLRGDRDPPAMSDRTNALVSVIEARLAIDNARGV